MVRGKHYVSYIELVLHRTTIFQITIAPLRHSYSTRSAPDKFLSVKSEEEGGDAEKANAKEVAEPGKKCRKKFNRWRRQLEIRPSCQIFTFNTWASDQRY